MTTSAWLSPPDPSAPRVLPLRLGGFALSPDDSLLAFWTGSDPATLRCIEVTTGREVFLAPGTDPVTALAWTSPEQLIAVRSSATHAQAELVAVPDGGLQGDVALPGLAADAHRVTLSADGRLACVARAGAADHAPTLAVVIATDAPTVVRAVAAATFDEAPSGVTRRAPMTAALHPDGHLLAVATGRSRLSPGGGRTGALWTLDLAAASAERVVSLSGLGPREVAWWSPSRVMVRAANLDPSAPWHQVRGALHVVDVGARRVTYDALALPVERDPTVRSRWLEPWVHASLAPDGARLVLGAEGINRASPNGAAMMGRVRVVDLATGQSDEPVELDTRVAVAASAVFTHGGLVTLTSREHRAATLTWPGDGAAGRRRVTVRFEGSGPDAAGLNGMRVERSPAGSLLVVWGYERRERGGMARHLALVDAAG